MTDNEIEQVYEPGDAEFATALAEVEEDEAREHFGDTFFGPGEIDGRCLLCRKADELGLWEQYTGKPLQRLLDDPDDRDDELKTQLLESETDDDDR